MAFWGRYVPVAERRAKALRQMDKLRKKGEVVQPVVIEGRGIAQSFWGKGWCDHLESFSDYENRLPRGRTYVRNGSVCHLEIQAGRVKAFVAGSSLYTVSIAVKKLNAATWKVIGQKCSGQIGSMLELLQGKLSNQVMAVVTDREEGLFPKPGEIELSCSCPDWAVMCKHVAAVLYGVGSRLDTRPELLFILRDVDAQALIAAEMALPDAISATADALADDQLSAIFGIDVEAEDAPVAAPKKKARQAKTRKPATSTGAAPQGKGKKDPAKAPASIRPTGKSVARLRKKLGLSMTQFAQQLGVSQATVQRWESSPGGLKLQSRPLTALSALQQQIKGK